MHPRHIFTFQSVVTVITWRQELPDFRLCGIQSLTDSTELAAGVSWKECRCASVQHFCS